MIRKTIYIIIFLFVLLVGAAKAQPIEKTLPDSLAVLLEKNNQADMDRVNALAGIVDYYIRHQQNINAQPYINEIEELSHELNNNYVYTLCAFYKGVMLVCMGKYQEALRILLYAEQKYKQLRTNEASMLLGARIHNSLSMCYFRSNLFPEFYQSIQQAMEINETLQDEYLRDVLEINYIVATASLQGNHEESIDRYQAWIIDHSETMSPNLLFSVYYNIACDWYVIKQYDSVWKYLDLSAELANTVAENSIVWNLRAMACNATGRYNEAILCVKNNLESMHVENNEDVATNALVLMAEAYHRLSMNDTALKIIDESIQRAQRGSFLVNEQRAMSLKNDILIDLEQYKEAADNYRKTLVLIDSVNEWIRVSEMEQLHLYYQFQRIKEEMKEQEKIHELYHQKKLSTMLFFIVLLIIMVTLILLLLNRKSILLKNKELQCDRLAIEKEKKDREIAANLLDQTRKHNSSHHIIEQLSIVNTEDEYSRKIILDCIKQIKQQELNSSGSVDFDHIFVEVHPKFFDNLLTDFPDLTRSDLRLCAYLKMNLNSKEIARINNITVNGVKAARKRLRKKFRINHTDESFTTFLSRY